MASRIKLFFLVPDTSEQWGSTLMRSNQLCEIAKRHIGNDFDCETMRMPMRGGQRVTRRLRTAKQMIWVATRPRGAIYFVPKQCLGHLYPFAAEMLQRRARGVLFDHVDSNMTSTPMCGADIHLCASHAQFEYLRRKEHQLKDVSCALLLHGYDFRLTRRATNFGSLRAVYWGAPRNTRIPSGIAGAVSVIDSESTPMHQALQEISHFNMHYGVRGPEPASENKIIFKPFTKGANAAACGANILINRDAHDAIDFLGEDYPYFVNSGDDDDIVTTFNEARSGINGSDWLRACSRMDSVASQLSPESVARQLQLILRPLTE